MSEVNGAVELKTNRKSNDLRYCNTKFLRMSLMGHVWTVPALQEQI